MIEKFEIIGLFGDRNIHIDFQQNENIKILVGENGTGKTHILNILYYILSGKLAKLLDIKFETIILKIKGMDKVTLNKRNIDIYFNTKKYSDINEKIDFFLSNIESLKKSLSIIYLPTYRRVEADLEKLGLFDLVEEFDKQVEDNFIQFGMDDTHKYINSLLDEIKSSSLIGFNEMSGDIINNLIDSRIDNDNNYDETIENIDILKIVLSRSNVSHESIKIIIDKVEKKDIYHSYNQPLFLYLNRLIKVYEKQKDKDELIKKFRDTCNKYLVDKNFFYNENSVDLYLKNEKNSSKLNLNSLSSGEKQLVSIFARIYLACEEDFILFIDEPEISMSMEWQKMILSDILDSKKCKLLFTTTHSPFIFNDEKEELINSTIDIVLEATTDYIKDSE